ncbi:hypothetical protein [Pseudomonas koreensis]|uniref:Phage tail tape measure protein n=1 Tax=Pseudomonas koreensis TaxID=198620 RepID=A0AA94ENP7_9PSED|nr:hypothetical protein [Pseudomonas koreensis]RVD76999.1 hypothetical protein A9HBioS_3022 [Pseudomonas koreensis]
MAFEAYSVAVKLSLINHVSAGMLMISKSLATAGQDVDKLNSKLASIGKQGAIGGLMVAGGLGIAAMFKGPLEEASKFQNEIERFRSLGLGDKVTNDAVKFASGMDTYGTSIRENLGLLRDAQTVFGDFHEAQMVTPLLAKMKFANAALFGEEGGAMKDRAFMDMLKVIELRGGLKSQDAFEKQANMIQQVQTATGGRVGANEFLNLIKTGGVAAKGMKDANFYYAMEPLVQEMGGFRVGTGLMSGYQNLVQGRTTQRAAMELMRIGMLDPDKVEYDKTGKIKQVKPGALQGSDLMVADPFQWMKTVMLPAFAAKGITSQQAILNEIGAIFTNRTASNLYSTMFLQQGNIEKNIKLNSGAAGIDELEKNAKNTMTGKLLELNKKWTDLQLKLGDVILPLAIRALDKLNPMLRDLAGWMDKNQGTVKGLTYALLGLSAFLIGGGLINMLIAAARGFQLLGAALFMNPIGLVIVGIAAVAFLLWNNWKEISSSLKLVWGDMKTMFVKLFEGDIIGAFKSFALAFLTGWQTVFNTLIAGVNFVLPASMQIQKTTFADDFRGGQEKKAILPVLPMQKAYGKDKPAPILTMLPALSGKPQPPLVLKAPAPAPSVINIVAPVPPKESERHEQPINLYIDGKKVSEVVVQRMAKDAAKPRTGTQGFDPSRSMLMPGTPSSAYPR